eukprot:3643232-Prymnesium_polylepis.1
MRTIENVKFELDVHNSLTQKRLEAVREEMKAGIDDAGRSWLDVARDIREQVGAALESERMER